MSTTVTYKGSTLTTAENQTRVLKTAGKYMEDDVTITDVTSGGGGDYSEFDVSVDFGTVMFSGLKSTSGETPLATVILWNSDSVGTIRVTINESDQYIFSGAMGSDGTIPFVTERDANVVDVDTDGANMITLVFELLE